MIIINIAAFMHHIVTLITTYVHHHAIARVTCHVTIPKGHIRTERLLTCLFRFR